MAEKHEARPTDAMAGGLVVIARDKLTPEQQTLLHELFVRSQLTDEQRESIDAATRHHHERAAERAAATAAAAEHTVTVAPWYTSLSDLLADIEHSVEELGEALEEEHAGITSPEGAFAELLDTIRERVEGARAAAADALVAIPYLFGPDDFDL